MITAGMIRTIASGGRTATGTEVMTGTTTVTMTMTMTAMIINRLPLIPGADIVSALIY